MNGEWPTPNGVLIFANTLHVAGDGAGKVFLTAETHGGVPGGGSIVWTVTNGVASAPLVAPGTAAYYAPSFGYNPDGTIFMGATGEDLVIRTWDVPGFVPLRFGVGGPAPAPTPVPATAVDAQARAAAADAQNKAGSALNLATSAMNKGQEALTVANQANAKPAPTFDPQPIYDHVYGQLPNWAEATLGPWFTDHIKRAIDMNSKDYVIEVRNFVHDKVQAWLKGVGISIP